MKKISMITLLMALMGVAVANPVSRDVARRVAQTWMQAQGMKNVAALQDITQQTPFAEFYVFAAPEGGFVLVSGDDCVQPVLAYSTVNRFEADGMPQHVRGFLEGYDKEIRWRKTHVQPVAQVYASRAEAGGKAGALPEEWQRLVDGAAPQPVLATAVAPLLTTTWDQSPYYNALCPTNGGEAARAVTGCVATATAQVMKYHNHPATGYGSHTYSSSRNVNGTQYTYNNLSANFGATTYQWSQMPNALTSASSTAQVNAVATLMYHIGVANEMAYSPEASGSNNVYGGSVRASSQHSLMKYFKYRADMAVVRRDDYSHDDYCQRLRAELDQSRPLLYEGSDESGGHSFVLDGYNNSGYFHVNWGWGGYFDDYYAIGGLEPAGGGTGANMGSYNLDNDVLIGLRPHTAWSATGNTTVSATVQAGSPSGAAVVVMGGGDNNYGTQSSTYAYGDTVMVVASAPNGYRFDSWNDGDRNNPRYLVANGGSYSFTASYAAIPTDTVSYCNSDAWLSAYSLGSDKHWGVMFPASLLDAGKELSAVMFYAYEAGTYNITVYTGSNRETTAATVSHVVGSDMTRQWQTVALPTAVAATQDVWITFYAPNVTYPAAFTNYSGVEASCLVGSSFDLYGGYWLSSFMVKGVFTEPVSCDITSFPYTEDFEDVNALGCWRIYDGDGDGHTWTYASNSTNPLGYNSNSSLASASYDNNEGPLTPDNWLIAPSFVLPAGSQMHLKWQAKGMDANYASEYYSVYVSTTGNAIGDFTSLTPVYSGTTTNAWVQQDVDLSAYAGQTVYLAFRHHNCTDMYYLLIDDVEVSAGVAPQPTQYTITATSNNAVWGTVTGGGTYNEGATATLTATASNGYHFVQWQDGNTQNPRTVTVTANATYTATFAADAAPQPGDTCAITSFPYTMDFESGVTCWSLRDYNQNDTTWGIINGYGYNGSRCAYVLYQVQADDWLMTPRVAVAGTYTVSWKTRAMSANYPETYQVWAMGNDTSVMIYSETLSDTTYVDRMATFTVPAGDSVLVMWRYVSADMYALFLDNVTISQGVSQYTITANSSNAAWGTVSGGGTYNAGATATLTATAAAGYHFVQWQDGNTQNPRTVTVTGNATYMATFASDASCTVTSFPWTEGFEGGIGACWSTIDNNNDGYGWEALGGFGNNGSSYSAASYSYVNGVGALTPDNWLVSPAIVVPATGSYDLSWAVSASNNDYPEEHYAVYVATAKTVTAFTTTVPVFEETLASSDWVVRTVSLAAYAGQTVYVAFRHYNCTDQYFIALDDVTITAGAAPQPTQYTITATSNNAAWGTVTGGGTYNAGATATLTATAATGYHFVQWQDGNTQNPRTVTVTANATYTATFAADAAPQPGDTCAITSFPYTMDFEGGVPCWSLRDYNQNDTTWGIINGYGYNGSRCAYVLYQAQADDWLMTPRVAVTGTHTVSWKTRVMSANYPETYQVWAMGNDTSVMIFSETLTDTLYVDRMATFTVPAGDSVLVMWRYVSADMYALFLDDVTISQGVAQYTITANSSNAAWGTVSGGGTYNAGATATLTATASNGYHFVQWQDGNMQNPRTVTVTGNATYTATFASDASCAVTSFPWTEGFEGGIGACWSTIDNNSDGYGWEALGGFGNNGSSYSAASYSYVNGVGALTPDNWLVSPAIVVPATGSYDLSWAVSASNNDYPEEQYAVYVATAKTVAAFTATTAVYEETLTAAQWATRTVSLAAYAGQTVYVAFRHYNCTDQYFMAIDDVTISEGSAPQYTVTAVSNNATWGTVTGGGTYNAGATVTLTATPATGYRFVSWQDGSTQNPRTVTVTANATYVATFEAIPPTQYTLTVVSNNAAWGTVTGGGTYNAGATVTLTATPATGYRFVSWQDGSTQNPRTVTVTANATYIVTFEAIPPTQYTLTVVSNNTAWGTVTGGGTYNEGSTATLTATAATGYHFVSWQDGNTQNPRTVTVTANATYVATFADNVGIDDVEAAVISVAPNPATVFVEVGGLKAGSSVSLVDINGKVCYRGAAENGKLTLDVSRLAAGVYFVRVSDGTETAVRKLVVK